MLKSVKFALRAIYKLCNWTLLPIFMFAFRRSKWKENPLEFGRVFLSDPDVVKVATDAGQAALLVQLRGQLGALARMPKAPTREDRDWGLFIQNYGENPQPDMVPAYLEYIQKGGTTGSTELPTAGAVHALCVKHPRESGKWRADFPEVFAKASEAMNADPSRPGWNDYYMVDWFVRRTDETAANIAERTKLPGMVGATCTWMAKSVAQQIPAFKEAMERVGYKFPEPDMKAAILHDNPNFKDAVEAERHFPMSQEVCNEFLHSLEGATITRAEMMLVDSQNEDEPDEHIEVITSAGMFCIVAPDLGVSFTKQTERKPC
jgi:hypothetical protein